MARAPRKSISWTDEEKSYLISNYTKLSDYELSQNLQRTLLGTREMRTKLRLIRHTYVGTVVNAGFAERDKIIKVYNMVQEMNNIIKILPFEESQFKKDKLINRLKELSEL